LDSAERKVTFRYKDYRHGAQQKTMTLQAEEFIRRFLLHVLPEGFQRVRYYSPEFCQSSSAMARKNGRI
jgi:Putative transposase